MASAASLDELHTFLLARTSVLEVMATEPSFENGAAVRRLLEAGIQNATYMIHAMAEQDPTALGMSTTLSALVVTGSQATIGQVGDSRVYLLRDGELMQITEDHTLINHHLKAGLITPEEAARSTQKNVITRAVGHQDYVEVDTFQVPLLRGDRFLLCSDGLHGQVETPELAALMQGEQQDVLTSLIQVSNDRGGPDNITGVLVDVLPDAASVAA